jgi:hypothetical protein
MTIIVQRDGKSVQVSLLANDQEVQSTVRFDRMDDAAEFADLWADWVGCGVIHLDPRRAALTAAA